MEQVYIRPIHQLSPFELYDETEDTTLME